MSLSGIPTVAGYDSPTRVYDEVYTDSEVEEPPTKIVRIEEDLRKTIDQLVQGQKEIKMQLDNVCLELNKLKRQPNLKYKFLRHRKNRPTLGDNVSSSSDDESSVSSAIKTVPNFMIRRKQRRRFPNNNVETATVPKTNETIEEVFVTAADLNLKSRCCFCWKNDHFSDDCGVFESLDYRVYCLGRYNLCNRCLLFHPGRICFVENRCTYCQKTDHHPALCPTEEHLMFLQQFARSS